MDLDGSASKPIASRLLQTQQHQTPRPSPLTYAKQSAPDPSASNSGTTNMFTVSPQPPTPHSTVRPTPPLHSSSGFSSLSTSKAPSASVTPQPPTPTPSAPYTPLNALPSESNDPEENPEPPASSEPPPVKRGPGRPKGSGKKQQASTPSSEQASTIDPVTGKMKRPVGRPRKDGMPAGSVPKPPKSSTSSKPGRPKAPRDANGVPILGKPKKTKAKADEKVKEEQVVSIAEQEYEQAASSVPATSGASTSMPSTPAMLPPTPIASYSEAGVPVSSYSSLSGAITPPTSAITRQVQYVPTSRSPLANPPLPYPSSSSAPGSEISPDPWDLFHTSIHSIFSDFISVLSSQPEAQAPLSPLPNVPNVDLGSYYIQTRTFWLPPSSHSLFLSNVVPYSRSYAFKSHGARFFVWDPLQLVSEGVRCPRDGCRGFLRPGSRKWDEEEEGSLRRRIFCLPEDGEQGERAWVLLGCSYACDCEGVQGKRWKSFERGVLDVLPGRLRAQFPCILGEEDEGGVGIGVGVALWKMVLGCLRRRMRRDDVVSLVTEEMWGNGAVEMSMSLGVIESEGKREEVVEEAQEQHQRYAPWSEVQPTSEPHAQAVDARPPSHPHGVEMEIDTMGGFSHSHVHTQHPQQMLQHQHQLPTPSSTSPQQPHAPTASPLYHQEHRKKSLMFQDDVPSPQYPHAHTLPTPVEGYQSSPSPRVMVSQSASASPNLNSHDMVEYPQPPSAGGYNPYTRQEHPQQEHYGQHHHQRMLPPIKPAPSIDVPASLYSPYNMVSPPAPMQPRLQQGAPLVSNTYAPFQRPPQRQENYPHTHPPLPSPAASRSDFTYYGNGNGNERSFSPHSQYSSAPYQPQHHYPQQQQQPKPPAPKKRKRYDGFESDEWNRNGNGHGRPPSSGPSVPVLTPQYQHQHPLRRS